MKRSRLVIFLTTFFILFGLINYYIIIQGFRAFETFAPEWAHPVYFSVILFLALSFPVARIAGKWLPQKIADSLAFLGGMWFAAMLYSTLSILVVNLVSFAIRLIPRVDTFLITNHIIVNTILFSVIFMLVISLIIYGYINAMHPKIIRLDIPVNRKAGNLKNLHLVFASDIHLGHVIGKKTLSRIVGTINSLKPDVVLFPGDLVDEELHPVIEKRLGEKFRLLKPKYGVFAVTGNHEYLGGVNEAVNYLSQFGIRFLRDEVVKIDESFYVAGREDVSVNSFDGKKRKTVGSLLENCNSGLPVIMMDHQPIAISEAKEAGVDLQISGHTHHGQMWPLQAITKRVFKLSHGYMKSGNSHFYVSSGAGTWGPRVRVGNHPEIVSIKLNFSH